MPSLLQDFIGYVTSPGTVSGGGGGGGNGRYIGQEVGSLGAVLGGWLTQSWFVRPVL